MGSYFLILVIVLIICIFHSMVGFRYRIRNGHYNVNLAKRDKRVLTLMFFVLIFFAAFRAYSVGTDAANYSSYYLRIGTSDDIFSIITSAPVYSIYNKLLYMIFPYRQAILISNSIIILVGIAYFIYNYSEDVCFSTILYIVSYSYCFSFNGMRQCIAMSMVLVALCWSEKKYKFRSIILLLLAIGIHNTAIFGLLSIPFVRKRMDAKTTRYIFVGSIIGMIILKYGYDFIINLFINIFPRYAMYINRVTYSAYAESQGRNIIVTLFYFAFVILVFILQRWQFKGFEITAEKRNEINKLLIPCIFSTVSGIIWADNFTLGRIREYYTIFFICMIPNLSTVFRRYKIIYKVAVVLVLLIPFYIQLRENKSDVIPYIFFWNY